MKKNRHQRTSKIIISIFTVGLFFGGRNFAKTIDTTTLVKGIDAMQKDTDKENFDEMIIHFCDAIANGKENGYDSAQSIFVYSICKYINKTEFITNKGLIGGYETSYINFIDDAEGNKVNELDYHLPGFYYKTENYIQELFDNIISSYTSIYQANIYGYANDPDKKPEDIIHENFAKKHFTIEGNEYIRICATDDNKSNYPKTCKKLKEYFYGGKNLINANTENYLNDQNIYKSIPDTKICGKNSAENIIACGLYGSKIDYFTNMVYNELLFYALFVEYYSYLLENKSDFKNRDINDFQKKLHNNEARVQKMIRNIEASREAIKITIKMLKETQYSLPIHIGFLMYSEDIYKFTSSMNKTLTPIYTLNDLLRNVQKTE